MKKTFASICWLIALAPLADAAPYDTLRLNLGGESSYDGWSNLSANSYPGATFPGTGNWPTSGSSWSAETIPGTSTVTGGINSNTAGSGDAFLYKISNGEGGGPGIQTNSVYFGGMGSTPNTEGGTVGIGDNTPLEGVQTVALQLSIGGVWGYDFHDNIIPVLTFTTSSGVFTLEGTATLLKAVYNGTQSVPTGIEDVYVNVWGIQYDIDLNAIGEPILSLSIAYTGVEHGQVYAFQLDQSSESYAGRTAFDLPIIWSGGGGNSHWSNASNWDGGAVPASGRDVDFINANVIIDSDQKVSTLNLRDSTSFVLNAINDAVLTVSTGIVASPGSSASYTINADIHMDEFNLITLDGPSDLTINGSLTGAGFYKRGEGSIHLNGDNYFSENSFNEIIFRGGSNTVSGRNFNLGSRTLDVVVTEGRLTLRGDERFGPGFGLNLKGGVLALGDESGGITQTFNGIASDAAGSIVGAHSEQSVLVVDSLSRNTEFKGRIGGNGTYENNVSLVKRGSGTLTLSGSNTYAGATVLEEGELKLTSSNALSSNSHLIIDGGTLGLKDVDFHRTLSETNGVELRNSAGFSAYDAVRTVTIGENSSSVLTWGQGGFLAESGRLVLSSTGSGALLKFMNGINLGASLRSVAVSSGNAELAGSLTGEGGLLKTGGGTLNLTAANTFTGVTQVDSGVLVIAGVNGSIAGEIVVNAGGQLHIKNSASENHTNRVSDSKSVTLNGGILNFSHTAGAASYSEKVGVVTLGAGASVIAASQAANGRTSTFTLSGLSRGTGATLNFNATGIGETTNRIIIEGQSNGFIGGWATAGAEFAKYDATTGVSAFSASDYSIGSTTTGWVDSTHAKINTTGAAVLDANRVVNSLNIVGVTSGVSGATRVDLNGYTLRIASGGLLGSGGNQTTFASSISNGKLTAGAEENVDAELFLHRVNQLVEISASIVDNGTGSVSVVKTGGGTVRLTGSNSYSGGTRVNQGTLDIRHAYGLGTGTLILENGAVINNGSSSALTLASNNQQVWKGSFTFTGSGQDLNLGTGAVTLERDISLTTSARTLTIGGVISGAYSLTKLGTGTLVLAGANEFSGDMILNAGTLSLAHVDALKNSRLILNGGTLDYSGLSEVRVGSLGGTSNQTIASGKTLTVGGTSNAAGRYSGGLSGGGTLKKTGSNEQVLSGAISHTGGTVVEGGTLHLSSEATLSGAGAVTIQSGGRLLVNGSISGGGALTIESGGTLAGSGRIKREFTVGAGATIAPGNSPGVMTTVSETWASGGTYLWSINDAVAGAGEGWSMLDIDGTLSITANSTDRFILKIQPLLLNNEAGDVYNFDLNADYSWVIATTTGGIIGFDADSFVVDFGLLTMGASQGVFSISQNGNDLLLNYEAVPEPSTYALIAVGAIGYALHRRRKAA